MISSQLWRGALFLNQDVGGRGNTCMMWFQVLTGLVGTLGFVTYNSRMLSTEIGIPTFVKVRIENSSSTVTGGRKVKSIGEYKFLLCRCYLVRIQHLLN